MERTYTKASGTSEITLINEETVVESLVPGQEATIACFEALLLPKRAWLIDLVEAS